MDPLWIDFINSDCCDYLGQGQHQDRLDKPDWLGGFLQRRRLGRINIRSRQVRAALRELRSLLQRFVRTIVDGRQPHDEDVDALNRYLGRWPVRSRMERAEGGYRVCLEPTAKGIEAVLFEIALSFAEFLVEDDPTRLKTCENADCKWVFYDKTRSRTRRWCADTCGNLMKVRRFRQRHRKGEPDSTSPKQAAQSHVKRKHRR